MFRFWGKTASDKLVHLLMYHLIDVANMAVQWMNRSPILSNKVHYFIDCEKQTDCIHFLAFLSGLHDIGKLSHRFQNKSRETCITLQSPIQDIPLKSFDHGGFGIFFMTTALDNDSDRLPFNRLEKEKSKAFKMALSASGSHHGRYLSPIQFDTLTFRKEYLDVSLQEYRFQMVQALWNQFPFSTKTIHIKHPRRFAVFLAGLVSICDWVASNDSFFRYVGNPMDIVEYTDISAHQSKAALVKTGLAYANVFNPERMQNPLLPFNPRPIQHEVSKLEGRQGLILIEAPTGEGKTEAALIHVVKSIQNKNAEGAFFGLPTRATSSAIYDRVLEFLSSHAQENQVLELTHSSSWIHQRYLETFETKENPYDDHEASKDQAASIVSKDWFHSSKRSLLAQFGVGTVDQIMKSVLATRHFFVRLFALSPHVVVFDEIHAYDSYMDHILTMLFKWLGANQIPTVLLSASLPATKKQIFLEAYANRSLDFKKDTYPLITLVDHQDLVEIDGIAVSIHRKIDLAFLHEKNSKGLLQFIESLVSDGGCGCIILNTVKRCQEVYLFLKEHIPNEVEIYCFHSQFTNRDRADMEDCLKKKFGKNTERPKAAILIATQVVEQSLDVDFDIMFSDLAPIDLLIQRMGRLHRHEGRSRPVAYSNPLFILMLGHKEPGCYVYPNILVLRTLTTLENKLSLHMPLETRQLIEAVYAEPILLPETALQFQFQDVVLDYSKDSISQWNLEEAKISKEMEKQAKLVIIPSPWEDNPIFLDTFDDEEADRTHLRAVTRLGETTIPVLFLYLEENTIKTLLDQSIFFIFEAHLKKDCSITEEEYTLLIFNAQLNLTQRKLGESEPGKLGESDSDRIATLEKEVMQNFIKEKRFRNIQVFIYKHKHSIPYSKQTGYQLKGGK